MARSRMDLARTIARVVLGGALIFAGVGHLTSSRTDFQAQVPDWVGLDKDLVVILSGLVEIALGLALIFVRRHRALLGLAVGLFFIAVFPGNISQFIDGNDAFGLDSDSARRNRPLTTRPKRRERVGRTGGCVWRCRSRDRRRRRHR